MLIDVEQNSDEWLRIRAGCCTASRVKEAIGKLRNGKYSADRQHYLIETVFGRITGLHYNHFVSEEMKQGLALEAIARTEYEIATGVNVERIGIAQHDNIKWFSASPDGLVGNEGGVEIKAPKASTHMEWVYAGHVPIEHVDQMNANMACTGRLWWDFVSYCPILPDHLQLFVRRLPRVEIKIEEMEREVEQFLADVEQTMERFSKHPPTLEDKLKDSLVMIGMETK